MAPSRTFLSVAGLILATALTTLFSPASFPRMAVASAADGPVYRVTGDVRPPKHLGDDPSVYPKDAKKEHVVGPVVMEAVIDRTGQVDDVRVIESVDPRLSKAASDAVSTLRYLPATKNGEAVNVLFTITINFHLKGGKKKHRH